MSPTKLTAYWISGVRKSPSPFESRPSLVCRTGSVAVSGSRASSLVPARSDQTLIRVGACKLLRSALSIRQKLDRLFEFLSCLQLPGRFEIPLEGAYAV